MLRITSSIDLGKAIRQTRIEQKMTQSQLAIICGVGTRFIVDLEKGKPTCVLDKSIKVAMALGINLVIANK